MQTLLSLMTKEPTAPSSIRRCDVDLETICLKCLQKEPSRRYDSAAALADDLERLAAWRGDYSSTNSKFRANS